MRADFALAAGLVLALSAAPATAQGPSYEKRGYGGPLYVGPNFEKGGQHAPPDYGSSKPVKQRATSKPAKTVRSASKGKAAKEPATEKSSTDATSSPAASGGDAKGSAVTSGPVPANDVDSSAVPQADTDTGVAATSTTAAAPTGPTTCKRFDAMSGQTITVPCD